MGTLSENVTNEKLQFLASRIEGERELSDKKKYDILPASLFRYEKATYERLKTLENNELYMSSVVSFNDPFDCKGFYWNTNDIYEYSKNNCQYSRLSKDEIELHFKKISDYTTKYLKIACFSENNHNLPMWGNYADNRKGFCVEYNFKELKIDSEFVKQLYPVFYQEERLDLTFTMKELMDATVKNTIHPILDFLYYKNLLKHSSWEYEQEWRLIFTGQEDNLVKMPIKPTMIYAGDQCSEENLEELLRISKKLSCGLIQLKPAGFDTSKFIFEEKIL